MLSLPPHDRAQALATEQAWQLATRLWESSPDPDGDYEVCRTMGWVAWLRADLLADESEHQEAVDLALTLLGQIWQEEPSDVPKSFLREFGLEELGPPQEPKEMADLGGDRLSDYLEAGTSVADLDFAVFALRWATSASPRTEPGRPGWLSNLSTALRQRWDKASLIDEAVAAAQEAMSPDGPGWHDPSFLWFKRVRGRVVARWPPEADR